METRFSASPFGYYGFHNPVIEILLVFVCIWAAINIIDLVKIKLGMKNKTETIEFDLWLFIKFLFKYAGIGIIIGCCAMIFFKFIDDFVMFQVTPFSTLIFIGILILFISIGLSRYLAAVKNAVK